MKYIFAAILLAALPVLAQSIVSPEVHPNGTVTFCLSATNAAKVVLHCESLPDSLMQKGTNGVWTLTTRPLEPDIYAYSFGVDGVRMIDPNNPFLKYNLLSTVSQVEVPGPSSLPWQITDVPRGELHRHFYHSAVCGDDRDYIVYTPPGYKPSAHTRYPVLYLLHGFSDDPTTWTQAGRANVILDNLIASHQARPMLVVMPLGYGIMDVLKAPDGPAGTDIRQRSIDKFTAALFTEVIPGVEKEYRVSTDRRSRAIAGLSMGGRESLLIGLNHLDKFAWIGAFSSSTNTDNSTAFPALGPGANQKLRLLWIGCGSEDKLLKSNQQLCEWLASRGVRYTWVEKPGQHSYRVWRRDLADFVPLLFR
jgi:enterochelin esterase-like enzyme